MFARNNYFRTPVVLLILFLGLTLASPLTAGRGKVKGKPSGPFQVAFVTRTTNNTINDLGTIESLESDAESLQAEVPGKIIGEVVTELDFTTIVPIEGTLPFGALIDTQGTLTTNKGSVSWETVITIIFFDAGDPDGILPALTSERGIITGGTGIFEGATGTVEAEGFLEGCQLVDEFCSPSYQVTPFIPDRGRRFDFNFILRGEFGDNND